jgi:spore germination cell wall hydrolase CwlJ-like protein
MLFATSGLLFAAAFAHNFLTELTYTADPSEVKCLALNIYWEARSEPVKGQLAVAHVTMNRVRSRSYPDSICGVVYQGNQHSPGACQFSWWCDDRSDRPTEYKAWQTSMANARRVIEGRSADPTGNALFYHVHTISPYWKSEKQRIARIGSHIFYR